ncbi:1-phosphofructokinase family hexose kinase [Phytoactinopolyspora limicola]|uniref:1-phosphofructokinase family hexose kinase n=1 Tax=Phytoactinopolyspora limicola TaxID=2715536 RepID=UPI00140AD876|nr:1-phosphofructokinase family hexose kinase [Phytoactinopolyspora limicola]
MTVLAVTPNPAVDVTYPVDRLRPGGTHRVDGVATRPGGKGLNVARVLHQRGVPVLVTGPIGGADGQLLRSGVESLGIPQALVELDVNTRRTVTIVDRAAGDATLFNEPGPVLTPHQWNQLRSAIVEQAGNAQIVTISGSLPPGIDPAALAELTRTIIAAGRPLVADTSGPALAEVAAAGPTVLKPNAAELREATGIDDPQRAAEYLRGDSVGAVVVSLGGDGLLAVTNSGRWRARLPRPLDGNPTGAGDSVVAAIAAGLRSGSSWPEIVRDACALSAATVRAPVAGEFDPEIYHQLLAHVDVHEVST